jgi:hypothetical protein
MVGFQQPYPGHFNIKLHLLFDMRVPGAKRFYLRIRQSRLINVFAGADGGLAAHDLRDEFLL